MRRRLSIDTPNEPFLPRNKHIYIAIALTLVVFNLVSVFGVDIPLHDDTSCYVQVIKNQFPAWRLKFNWLDPYKEWAVWHVMVFSLPLARVLYILFLLVPIACGFYYLYRHKFQVPPMAAFAAAVLPTILPFQVQVPAGINMSYVLWVLLPVIFAIVTGLHYLEKNTPKNWLRLTGAVALYVISTGVAEPSVFLFPPIALLFLAYTRLNKKHIFLISGFFIAAVLKYLQISGAPRKPMFNVPPDEILHRFGLWFKWSLPSPDVHPIYIVTLYAGIVIAGFIIALRTPRLAPVSQYFSHLRKRTYVFFVYGFFACWSLGTQLYFILFNKPYSPRYAYISAFGLNALVIISLFLILKRFKPFSSKSKAPFFIFLFIVLFSGTYRFFQIKSRYAPANRSHAIITRDLANKKIPPNSQLVITGVHIPDGGWKRSEGYFKFALERNDITGLIGPVNSSDYYHFDDHFDTRLRRFSSRYNMTGLSLKKPTFLFAVNWETEKLEQMEYCLQWKGKTMGAAWTIHKSDKTNGRLTPFISGAGMAEYLETINKPAGKGISQSQILWGGPPTPSQLQRLHRLELAPRLFQGGSGYNRFDIPEQSKAERFLTIAKYRALIDQSKKIIVGNRFRLSAILPDEVTKENGDKVKLLHILWQTRKKLRVNRACILMVYLLKNREHIMEKRFEFRPGNIMIEPGEFLFGTFKIPFQKFAAADQMAIGVSVLDASKNPVKLPVRVDGKTSGDGYRLLIPLN